MLWIFSLLFACKICFLLVLSVLDSKGNSKYAKNAKKGITSAMECADVAAFIFAMWQIKPCLLCMFISQKRWSLIYLQLCEYFLWVSANEANSLAVHRSKLKDLRRNWIFAEVNKNLPELATFKSSARGKNTTILKLALDSVNRLIVWLAWLLQSTSKLNFDFSGRKLFIKSVINSVTLVSFCIIHGHIPSELPD